MSRRARPDRGLAFRDRAADLAESARTWWPKAAWERMATSATTGVEMADWAAQEAAVALWEVPRETTAAPERWGKPVPVPLRRASPARGGNRGDTVSVPWEEWRARGAVAAMSEDPAGLAQAEREATAGPRISAAIWGNPPATAAMVETAEQARGDWTAPEALWARMFLTGNSRMF